MGYIPLGVFFISCFVSPPTHHYTQKRGSRLRFVVVASKCVFVPGTRQSERGTARPPKKHTRSEVGRELDPAGGGVLATQRRLPTNNHHITRGRARETLRRAPRKER